MTHVGNRMALARLRGSFDANFQNKKCGFKMPNYDNMFFNYWNHSSCGMNNSMMKTYIACDLTNSSIGLLGTITRGVLDLLGFGKTNDASKVQLQEDKTPPDETLQKLNNVFSDTSRYTVIKNPDGTYEVVDKQTQKRYTGTYDDIMTQAGYTKGGTVIRDDEGDKTVTTLVQAAPAEQEEPVVARTTQQDDGIKTNKPKAKPNDEVEVQVDDQFTAQLTEAKKQIEKLKSEINIPDGYKVEASVIGNKVRFVLTNTNIPEASNKQYFDDIDSLKTGIFEVWNSLGVFDVVAKKPESLYPYQDYLKQHE